MPEFNGNIGHLTEIESPWGNAGWVAKSMEDVAKLAQTGVGWIEDGSQTLEPRLGNAFDPEHVDAGPVRTVYTYNVETGETGNSLGMPGKGIEVWAEEIPEKVNIAESYGKKFVQNVAPVTDSPTSESVILVGSAYQKGAHAVLLNAGCPNVVTEEGGRHELLSRDPDALYRVLVGLRTVVDAYEPIFLRISPQVSRQAMRRIVDVIVESNVVSAVFTPNTWPGFIPLDSSNNPILEVPGGAGGRSGPATAADSRVQTRWAVEMLDGSGIDVVSSSGIMDSQELKHRLKIGAAAGAGTTFFYEPVNGWAEDTGRMLTTLAG